LSATFSTSAFRFGDFEFDPRTGELHCEGRTIRLAPQPCRILATLLDRAGQLVERDELRNALWSRDTFVDFDLGLNYCINRLRAVLGDDARAAQFIETVPKRGYRFIANVRPIRGPREPAVAVLPFESLNRDPLVQYLPDSVMDALIDALARTNGIRVISRQSIIHLRGTTLSLAEISRALNVDAVVEGATLCVGTRARVTARLVQIQPEQHLWVDSYEGELADLLAMLSSMARQFADAIARAMMSPMSGPPRIPRSSDAGE
jgi:TolB-like protein